MVQKLEYPNGLKVVVDTNKNVKTVCSGIWVGSGSANEDESQNGIAHFVEHMIFKGTDKLSPFDVADRFERYGAQVNAFTGKEYTCYYFKSVDDNVVDCFDTLTHIFFDSDYKQDELEKERKVVIEEINMVEDNIDDLCFDLIAKINFDNTSLGNTILGPIKNVARFDKSDIKRFTSSNYSPSNITVAFAGNIDIKGADRLVKKYMLDRLANQTSGSRADYPQSHAPAATQKYIKDFEQSNIILSYPSIKYNDKAMYIQSVLNTILGGGMSSRLFQSIREQNGLCYSVYTTPIYYSKLGTFNVVCNITPSNTSNVIELIKQEIDKLCSSGVSDSEFDRAKAQLKSAFVFSQESTQSCMTSIGKLMVGTGELFDYQQRLAMLDRVSKQELYDFAKGMFAHKPSIAYVGRDISVSLDQYIA